MIGRVRPTRLAAATTAATVVAAMGTASAWAQEGDEVVLSVGHVDVLDVHYDDGELSLMVKDDTSPPAVVRDPADVIVQALPASAETVPDDDRYAFLGAPGDTVWILPQVQNNDLLWPGWNTERLSSGTFEGNQITLTLESVDGPGLVSIYNVDGFGNPAPRWHAEDGEVDPESLPVPINTHAHGAWAFGAEGTYTLTFRVDATLSDGGEQVTSGPVDYTFVVGDLPGNGNGDVELTVAGMQPSYEPGDTVELTAVQDPDTGEEHYHWYSLCPGGDEFVVVPDELEGTYTFTAESELDGCEYLVRLFDDDHDEIAASPPVTLNVTDEGDPGDPELSQSIIATIDEMDGTLVVSVDPDDRTVIMSVAELNGVGDRLESTGELRPVTVTDTRPGAPGWNVSGQVGDFTGDAGEFAGSLLGWSPEVLAQADGQGVTAGDQVPTGFESGDGLAVSQVLGSAGSGDGLGTAELGAGLVLELPTETPAGEYTATLTLTAI